MNLGKMLKKSKTQKNINFNANGLPPNIILHLNQLSKLRKKGEFIRDAIKQHYFYTTNFRMYIKGIIKLNFGLVRHVLRKVGRKNVGRL